MDPLYAMVLIDMARRSGLDRARYPQPAKANRRTRRWQMRRVTP